MANMMQGMNGLNGGMNPGGFVGNGLPQGQAYKQKSGINEFFTGNRGGFVQTPRYSQNQSQGIEQILQQVLGMLNPQAIEQQATNRFNQQTLPGIAERFSSLGNNALSSPSFASQVGQAAGNMNVDIQALLSQLATQLLPYGLTQQQDTHYNDATEGFGSKLLGAGLQAGGTAAGAATAGHFANKGLEQIIAMLNKGGRR